MCEAKKNRAGDMVGELVDLSAPEDRGADVVEAKKRRTGDVAGGKRRLQRQVKTATVAIIRADMVWMTILAGKHSFAHQQCPGAHRASR